MANCIPDSTGKTCVNCGWQWKKDTPFPCRNCPASPDLQPAADKLGVSLPDIAHYATAIGRWMAAGFPERSQEEVELIESTICRPCEHYRDGRCAKCGCRVTKGPALVNKIRMATETCPALKW